MSSKPCLVAMATVAFFFVSAPLRAQAQETVPLIEVGAHVTALNLGDFKLKIPDLSQSQRGAGGRVTVNVNSSVSIEAEYNVFPRDFRLTIPQLNSLVKRQVTRDRVNQFLIGVKVGKRSDRFGIFAKLRPGYVSATVNDETTNPTPSLSTLFRTSAGLALDAGVVFEFYPTRHTMFRFDAGDLITRYERKPISGSTAATEKFQGHSLQLSAGFGLRF